MQAHEGRYRTLLAVTNVLNSLRDTESLWRGITEQIRHVIPWERAGVTLYDQETDCFHFYAVETRLAEPLLKRHTVIPREGSAVGWVYEHRRIHVRPDLKREQVFIEDGYYAREGLGRMINAPLLVGDTCIGTLNVGSAQQGQPDPDDVEFLQLVARQVAYAIAHVQAYEQIDQLRQLLAQENAYLVEELRLTRSFGAMIGHSAGFRATMARVEAVGPTTTSVLVTGETGTGKELMARAIHKYSARADKPFVRLNCGALPIGLIESELFGHERGAFAGATHRRLGRFELAHTGTLFLDEIGEMPIEVQAKLLRVLEEGLVDRVGGTHPIAVDVRIIAATNADLAAAVTQGRFRSDLYYRLNVFPIAIPPLRDRREDIALLAGHFLEACRIKLKRPQLVIDPDSMDRLLHSPWPGNVRQLQNVIERAVILSQSPTIRIDAAMLNDGQGDGEGHGQGHGLRAPAQSTNLVEIERAHIRQVLESCRWRIYGPEGAAARLGLNPSTLRSRMKKLGLSRRADASRS